MIDLNLDEVYKAYEDATGKSIEDNKIKLNSDSDWLRHKAKESLKDDPSGLLTSIMLKGAYKSLLKECSLTMHDLIKDADESLILINKFKRLDEVIEKSIATELYYRLVAEVTKVSELLNKPISINDIMNFDNSEEVFVDAIKHFNNDHLIIKEKFQIGGKLNTSGKILTALYKFEHYKQFINALKETHNDNFICIALINRTVETAKTVYDEKYDKFFALGIKNNNNIFVVSDRKVTRSPEFYAHSRNPSREYEYKLSYSHLPYHKFNEIYKDIKSDTLLLTDGSESDISDDFDIEAILYLGTILMLTYNKYFTQSSELQEHKLVHFASDIKLLSESESKALKVIDDNVIVKPNSNVSFKDFTGEDKLFNTGIFDCWLEEYPLKESDTTNLAIPDSIIADKDTMKNYAWWLIRKKQADNIKQKLNEAHMHDASIIREWVGEKLQNNAETIIQRMFSEPVRKGISNYVYSCNTFGTMPEKNKLNKPVLWIEYANSKDIDLYDIVHAHDYDNYDGISASSKIIDTKFGKLKFNNYRGYCTAYFIDDANSRKSRINLTLRSTYDLERFLNVTKDELPKPLRHYLYSRVDSCGRWGWKPYGGNSILDLTDPMNDIDNPFEDFHIGITIALSKRKYNEIIKSTN